MFTQTEEVPTIYPWGKFRIRVVFDDFVPENKPRPAAEKWLSISTIATIRFMPHKWTTIFRYSVMCWLGFEILLNINISLLYNSVYDCIKLCCNWKSPLIWQNSNSSVFTDHVYQGMLNKNCVFDNIIDHEIISRSMFAFSSKLFMSWSSFYNLCGILKTC